MTEFSFFSDGVVLPLSDLLLIGSLKITYFDFDLEIRKSSLKSNLSNILIVYSDNLNKIASFSYLLHQQIDH